MEAFITLICILLGGANCETEGVYITPRPTPALIRVLTPVAALATPVVEVEPYTPENPNCNYAHYPTVLYSMAISPGGKQAAGLLGRGELPADLSGLPGRLPGLRPQ